MNGLQTWKRFKRIAEYQSCVYPLRRPCCQDVYGVRGHARLTDASSCRRSRDNCTSAADHIQSSSDIEDCASCWTRCCNCHRETISHFVRVMRWCSCSWPTDYSLSATCVSAPTRMLQKKNTERLRHPEPVMIIAKSLFLPLYPFQSS